MAADNTSVKSALKTPLKTLPAPRTAPPPMPDQAPAYRATVL